MLPDGNVVAHRAAIGRRLAGFMMSRMAAGEAELCRVTVA